jgi:hypothetical protein
MVTVNPDPSCITTNACGTEIKTTLGGFILPGPFNQPADCLDQTPADYIDRSLILSQINDQWHVIGMCGSTGLGLYYYGCFSGELPLTLEAGDPATTYCELIPTGEMVTAQVCKISCEDQTPLPTGGASETVVLVAKIGAQWFIVNVITRGLVTHAADFQTPNCADACCGIGFKQLEVTIGAGCGSLSGQTFLMAGAGAWSGSLTAGGDTFRMLITCAISEAGANDWAVSGGCGSLLDADDFNISCGNGMSGNATFSEMTCSSCSSVSVTFESVTPPDRICETVVLTGETVVMEACGVPALEIDDKVIMANVPKIGSPCTTGTGTGNILPQWQMIQACSDTINCGAPCPPPEPPADASCCDWTTIQVPETLTGTISSTSDDSSCECSGTITFELTPNSIPPIWNQVGVTCETGGTGTSGNALTGITGLQISCSGALDTGTGTGTGSGTPQGFLLLNLTVDTYLTSGSCEPVIMSWEDIETGEIYCEGGTFPPTTVKITIEVAEA